MWEHLVTCVFPTLNPIIIPNLNHVPYHVFFRDILVNTKVSSILNQLPKGFLSQLMLSSMKVFSFSTPFVDQPNKSDRSIPTPLHVYVYVPIWAIIRKYFKKFPIANPINSTCPSSMHTDQIVLHVPYVHSGIFPSPFHSISWPAMQHIPSESSLALTTGYLPNEQSFLSTYSPLPPLSNMSLSPTSNSSMSSFYPIFFSTKCFNPIGIQLIDLPNLSTSSHKPSFPYNTHQILTWSYIWIYIFKSFMVVKILPEPTSIREALKIPEWKMQCKVSYLFNQ